MRYYTKLICGDWYVVDSLTTDSMGEPDKVKKCPTKFEASLAAAQYNGRCEADLLFAMAFGV